MKILVVSQRYYPEQFNINSICEELVKQGNEVTVLCGLPNYPQGYVPKEYKWFRRRRETINGVKVIRTLEIGRKKGLLALAVNYVSFYISSCFKVFFLKGDYDIVFSNSLSPIMSACAAVLYKKLHKKPLLLYCLDLWPESLKSVGMKEDNIVFKLAKKLSRHVYSNCDKIAVSSQPFMEYLSQTHGISKEKMVYLPQHADDSLLSMDLQPEENGIVDIVYTGNVGRAQDVDCIVNAVELLKDMNNFKVHIVGGGSMLNHMQQSTEENGLTEKIVFHGMHPANSMPKFYKLADACLLTLCADNLVGLTVPAKLQGYMAAGKPVIAAVNGAAREIIEKAECGLCAPSGNAAVLAENMRNFIQNTEKYRHLGDNGRKYFVNNFTQAKFMTKLNDLMGELI